MTRRELEELPDADLVARCTAAVSQRMHVADPAARASVIGQLTAGQRMLLALCILHSDGDRGLAGFCAQMSHRLVHDGFWTLLEDGLRLVDDAALLSLVHRLRSEVTSALSGAGYPEGLGRDGELDHDGFVRLVEALSRLDPEVMRWLDEEYRRTTPGSLRRVARHIRVHPGEFVSVEA